ncbi:hypothetical protein ACJ69_05480 [Enterobacter asburiae]|uniref:HNH endonuclease n=1 Tax=Enterobacter asburiae TaxID=61645 RepID=A0A376FBC6_ENTAS|nr:hypothetical protein ACJ69_05480 [Enterobacter asburiae]STD19975.1 Uncharacterised protein [Enterobacter asburiae]
MPSKDYYHNRRTRLAKAVEKLGGRCESCGSEYSLQFDHIDPSTKSANVSEMHYHSDSVFYAEVEKCQLLCSACHIQKTKFDLSYLVAGELNGMSKLTMDSVQFIRENYIPRHKVYGARGLGRMFGVTHQTVLSALNGETWK